jgi:DNA-binding beta-propeller fold protein YncE/predicted Ser/Thr protein kinase
MSREPTEPGHGPDGAGLTPGVVFAGLEIEGEVGRGGMGIIYRARDPELDRVRALKVLAAERSADDEFRERFRRESRQAASIEHPNVVPVYRAGEESGRLYLVMRFVDGPSLAEVLADRGRLRLDETVDLVQQVAAGLDAAHAAGLVHRDVKPANILLEADGRAFLGDFGISKLAEAGDQLTSTGQFVGTVDYVAPEQLEGEAVDRRADVYSLACVAYHLLTGEPPFPRDTQLATMFAHANAPRPEAGRDVPSKVREVLRRGMAIDPDDRPLSAGEFAAELERAAGASSVATTERLSLPERDRRGARLLSVVAGIAGLVAVAAAIVLLAAQDDPDSDVPPVEARTLDVPPGPLGITVGPGRAWVASPPAERVTSIRLDSEDQQEFEVGSAPAAVAVGFDSVWVVDRKRGELVRIDPATGAEQATVGVGDEPADVAIGADDVWVANAGSNTVSRVDPSGGGAVEADTITVADHPSALAATDDGVWVANRDGGTVMFISAGESRLSGRPIDAGPRPNDLALGAGLLWVADNVNSEVTSFDPESREMVGEPVAVGALPRSIAFGLGYVWVANGEDGTVSRIDPDTGDVSGDAIPVGAQPASIAVGPDSVWTADFGDSTVTELVPSE